MIFVVDLPFSREKVSILLSVAMEIEVSFLYQTLEGLILTDSNQIPLPGLDVDHVCPHQKQT